MSFGKMNSFIDIISAENVIDSEGFSRRKETILASVRAYREDRHGNRMWANMASFSEATVLFRFRKIPNLNITTKMDIACSDGRYSILSVENIKGKDMYIEILTKKIEASC
ncbi:MAG: phage head closure protein [Acutalibacteraceae bacterium]